MYRSLEMEKMTSPPGAVTHIDGREMDYFCGTGYFGLQGHPSMIKAACDAVQCFGLGPATSRAAYGNTPLILKVEQHAEHFFDQDSALYCASGYLSSAVVLQGLRPEYDVIFVDEQAHCSIMDGAKMACKPVVTFAHCDATDLKNKIRDELQPGKRPLVVSDGIFPVTGTIPPLLHYHQFLSEIEGAILCVDDAHALGVIGEKGRGTLEHYGIQGAGRYSFGTLSKAFGGYGGIITGSTAVIDGIKRNTQIIKGSSPVPTPAAAATAYSIDLLARHPEIRHQLWANVSRAKNGLRDLGVENIPHSQVPIIWISGENLDLASVQKGLFTKGIVTLYIPSGSYTNVPEKGGLRIAIFSTHTKEQIDRLIFEIGNFL